MTKQEAKQIIEQKFKYYPVTKENIDKHDVTIRVLLNHINQTEIREGLGEQNYLWTSLLLTRYLEGESSKEEEEILERYLRWALPICMSGDASED